MDLPEPEAPIIATVSPEVTEKLIGLRICSEPSLVFTFLRILFVSMITEELLIVLEKPFFVNHARSMSNMLRRLIWLPRRFVPASAVRGYYRGSAELLLLIILLFSANVHSDQAIESTKNVTEYKLLVLGDSLSAAYGLQADQGWVHLLKEAWQSEGKAIKVINAAISGDTTDGGLARLPRLFQQHTPTHLWIELGGNNGLQGHNPRVIKQNLAQMIELAQNKDIEVILQEIQIPTNYGRRYTQMFTDNYHQLAEEYNIALFPFFLSDIALNADLMQSDGIHPTADAQPLIVDFLKPRFEREILR